MNKEQFVAAMHKKLHVIEEHERQDIIDEYINHIDMKMQEGKTEEEVIEDFGDIDELVKDILDAYKINTSSEKSNYDEKFNSFLDDVFDRFKRFISSFTSLDVDDVVKFIFEVFVILILLLLLKIPFSIVGSLGASLLSDIIGLGVGSVFAAIWSIIINLAYAIIFIVVLFSTCSKRIDRYRNHESTSDFMEDFKESLRFEKRPHTNFESFDKTEHDTEEKKKEYQEHPYQPSKEPAQTAGSVVEMILKIFSIFLFIPFFMAMAGLCIVLGVLVALSFHGVVFIGGYFILIGCIIGASAFISLIYRTIWKGGNLG